MALSISAKMAPGPDNRQDLTPLDQNQQESSSRGVMNDTIDGASEVATKDVSSVVSSCYSMIASVGKLVRKTACLLIFYQVQMYMRIERFFAK